MCPFCEKINLKKLAYLESVSTKVIYNIAPIIPGHSLVIPKRHVQSLLDLDEKELMDFMCLGLKAVKVLRKVWGKRDFNFSIQDGPGAEQSVPHLHAHVLIRERGDFSGNIHHEIADSRKRPKLSDKEMAEIVEKLRKCATNV